jgi:ABC-type branched-subunit amino acid transport system ATPase component
MNAFLEVKNLRKEFGGVVAVDDNNFSVHKGERLGIIGPNGAGKTTTFNMIAGYFKPTSGTITYEGRKISGLKPYKISQMGIGRTFQIARAFGAMTVYDHVLTGLLAHHLHFRPTAEQHERVEYILKLTKLAPYRDNLVKNLTIASQRRIVLATALAAGPKLLLLDELMAGLTFVEIDETLEELRNINENMGVTLIVVEHVMKAIMQLCNRIIVLNYGKIIAEGTPKEVANDKTVIEAYLGEEETYA